MASPEPSQDPHDMQDSATDLAEEPTTTDTTTENETLEASLPLDADVAQEVLPDDGGQGESVSAGLEAAPAGVKPEELTQKIDAEADDGGLRADQASCEGDSEPEAEPRAEDAGEKREEDQTLQLDDTFDPYPDQLLWPDEVLPEKASGQEATDSGAESAPTSEVGPTEGEGPRATSDGPVPDEAAPASVDKGRVAPQAKDIPDIGEAKEQEVRLDAELFDDGRHQEPADESFSWQPPQQEEKQVKAEKGKKRVVAILIALVLICSFAGIYVLMVQSFEGKYLPRTTINGLDVGGLTREEALSALETETEQYGVEIRVGDYAGAFMGRHIGLSRDEAKMIEETWPEVDPRMWLPHLIAPQEFKVEDGIDFNEPVLRDVVMRSVDDHNNMALPHDQAHITLDEASGTYTLSGTTSGTAVDKQAVADAAVADVREFKTHSTPDPDACLHPASVTDLPAYSYAVVRANICRTNAVPILVAGEQVDELTVEQARAWVTIDDEPKVVVDEEALRQWAEDRVVYTAWHQDDWSSYYLDVDAFVAGLAGRLSLGIVEGYEVPVIDELKREGASREYAYERGGWNPELGRYIDVDLEAQFVRLFDETGNVIWESACVSGDVYQDRSTVVGMYEIYAKQTNTTLVGLDYNNDGNPDYESFVNYWMPFYGGYGLHDATWRSTFGGDLYYYDGSHGCINLPFAKARELFDITFVGEKVNVHY